MTSRLRAASAAAVLPALLLAAPGRGVAGPDAPRSAGCGDPVLSSGAPIASTTSTEDERTIRALLDEARRSGGLPPVVVDDPLDGSVYPPEFPAPTFVWHDPSPVADAWLVDVAFDGGSGRLDVLVRGEPPKQGEIDERCISRTNEIYKPTPYQASARTWKPCAAVWEAIKKGSAARTATVTLLGYRRDAPGRVISRGRTTLSMSSDPVGAPIFYRDVPLMPSMGKDGVIKPLDQAAQPLIQWRLRDVARTDGRVLLKDMPTCANCHSFSADGRTFGMDVDGPDGDKGAYALTTVKRRTVIDNPQVITWNAFPGKPKDHYTLGFLARVSPDGRHVVATVNESLYVRNYTDYKILQTFYPTRGILAVYSRDTGEIRALPGADDPAYVYSDAVWTPDGKTLVFARAKARDPYDRNRPVATYSNDPNETPIQYDLYRIPFDDGRGGTAVPIAGASGNGMSNSFPKVTPDGKWIVWVQARNGQLLRPDGKLWIVPFGGGTPRLMRCNTPLMNSWHSISPNGRWMVFSSKKNTPYTQLFLTHLDAAGNDTPPILIENSQAANRAANIPEFVNVQSDEFREIVVPALDHYDQMKRGNELAREGKHQEAVAEYQKALSDTQDWRITDWRIHENMSKTLLKMGRTDEALEHIRESLRLNPGNSEMQANLGYILFERGKLGEAREHLDIALKLRPDDPQAWYNRATLRLNVGDGAGALGDYNKAIELDPKRSSAYRGRGSAFLLQGDTASALADFETALELDPKDPAPWYFRAGIRAKQGDLRGALSDLDRAAALLPKNSPQRADVDALRGQIRAALPPGS